ncbi:mucin-17-like [Helianthus annuus]|uniref:mucin-17-like n=1 Tax=Helianthus annuus TaxID=4232 RepID=UPI000B9061E7|nr:mucin-17-like [Helianthus annuus]
MFYSPAPGAISLSTPILTTTLPTTILPLFKALDVDQTVISSSQQPITENILQQVTESDASTFANPSTVEEVTPLELHVSFGGSSSGAATTCVESTDLHLESSFISQTPLKAISSLGTKVSTGVFKLTTGVLTKVTTAEERSPQYQEKGAAVDEPLETSPGPTADTTSAGGKSNDPIKLGDGLKYQNLTERVTNLETSVADIKNMLQQLLQSSKSRSIASSSTTTTSELWQLLQPLFHQQRKYNDQQHQIQLQMLKNVMESRYKDTQADIKAIKAHLLQTTGTSPPTIVYVENPNDAKKEAKGKKGKDGLYLKPDPKTKPVVEIPRPDVTLNAFAEQKANRKEKMERKAVDTSVVDTSPSEIPTTVETPVISTDVETPVISTAVDTSVVSTVVVTTNVVVTLPTTTQPTSTPAISTAIDTSVVDTSPSEIPNSSSPQTTKPIDDETPVISTVVDTSVVDTSTSEILKSSSPQTSGPIDVETPVISTTVAVDTSVVSTVVVTTNAVVTLPTTTQSTNPTPSSTPTTTLKIKRRRITNVKLEDDTVASPLPISSQPLIISTVQKPASTASILTPDQTTDFGPLSVKFPLDLPAVREEIKSFYSEDDPEKRSFPSLQEYPLPKNIHEYLQLEFKQAEDISKRDTKGKSDKEIQRYL